MIQKLSYQYRLYLSFSIIIMVILICSGSFFYHYNVLVLHQSVKQNSMESLSVICARIEDSLEDMDSIIKNIQVSTEFRGITFQIKSAENNYFTLHPSEKAQLNTIFLSALLSENLSTNLNFVSQYYDYLGVYMNIFPYSREVLSKQYISNIEYVKSGMTTQEFRMFLPPHDNPWITEEQKVFSVVRSVRDNYNTYGILVINKDVEELKNLCNIQDIYEEYEIIILDEKKQVIYETASYSDSDIEFSEYILDERGTFNESKNMLYSYQKSNLTGWTIVMKRDLTNYNEKIISLRKTIFWGYSLGFLIILTFLYEVTKSLTKPLKKLRDNLSNLEIDKKTHIHVNSSSNEVTVLAAAIEEILNKMKQQNDMLIQTRKREIKAHVDMLDAQMDPHFLYNTLSVIGACGYEDGSTRVNQMCRELANLLRYSIKFERKYVELKDEFQNVRNYLSIMKVRYEEYVEIDWELDETLSSVKVPKLVLQPIVENCFKHGFYNQTPVWKIIIISQRKEGQWRILIKNNGNSFEQKQITNLKIKYEEFIAAMKGYGEMDDDEKKGVGLENTLKRLYLLYGDSAHYHIYEEDGWSVVEIGGKIDEG